MFLLDFHARRQFRQTARSQGKTAREISEAMDKWDRFTLSDAAASVEGGREALAALDADLSSAPGSDGFAAIGDGTILQKILDFFNSPVGQLILKALLAALFTA